jgi:hypothetical protein
MSIIDELTTDDSTEERTEERAAAGDGDSGQAGV